VLKNEEEGNQEDRVVPVSGRGIAAAAAAAAVAVVVVVVVVVVAYLPQIVLEGG